VQTLTMHHPPLAADPDRIAGLKPVVRAHASRECTGRSAR